MNNYEKKYKEVLDKAKKELQICGSFDCDAAKQIFRLFPELKDSEDEKVREELIAFLKENHETGRADETWSLSGLERWIAWLSKKGEQKSTLSGEDKRMWKLIKKYVHYNISDMALEADHVTREQLESWLEKQGERKPQGKSALEAINEEKVDNANKVEPKFKDGDVLNSPSNRLIWIYKDNEHYYACVNMNYVTENVATDGLISIPNDACPATKDEQNILFARMKDAGYEWDAKLKQLRKIEDEIEIPYGSKDSELIEESYYIPKGFHAEIEGDKVVIKKGENPTAWTEWDEDILSEIIYFFEKGIIL